MHSYIHTYIHPSKYNRIDLDNQMIADRRWQHDYIRNDQWLDNRYCP